MDQDPEPAVPRSRLLQLDDRVALMPDAEPVTPPQKKVSLPYLGDSRYQSITSLNY
jgi:hypothetical protein